MITFQWRDRNFVEISKILQIALCSNQLSAEIEMGRSCSPITASECHNPPNVSESLAYTPPSALGAEIIIIRICTCTFGRSYRCMNISLNMAIH